MVLRCKLGFSLITTVVRSSPSLCHRQLQKKPSGADEELINRKAPVAAASHPSPPGTPVKRTASSRVAAPASASMYSPKRAVTPTRSRAAASSSVNLELQGWEGESADEIALRQFDLDVVFGPSAGLSRRERWERAAKFGLNPPAKVLTLIERAEAAEATDKRQREVLSKAISAAAVPSPAKTPAKTPGRGKAAAASASSAAPPADAPGNTESIWANPLKRIVDEGDKRIAEAGGLTAVAAVSGKTAASGRALAGGKKGAKASSSATAAAAAASDDSDAGDIGFGPDDDEW